MMERRTFIEKLIAGIAFGGVFLLAGCQKKEDRIPRSGSEDQLWKLSQGQAKAEEPLDPGYAKGTPAFYRDASLGKLDPSFAPKTGGG
jgi:hypothetical protein